MPRRVPCVGALVRDPDDRLLVVRRARPPAAGLWSIPGGRVEAGETPTAAVVREVREETGLDVTVGALVGRVERAGPNDVRYDIADYAAVVVGGVLVAGDDAEAVRWVTPTLLRRLPTAPGLVTALERWGVIPAAGEDPDHSDRGLNGPGGPGRGGEVGRPGCSPPRACR